MSKELTSALVLLNTSMVATRDTIICYLRKICSTIDIKHSLSDFLFYLIVCVVSYLLTTAFDSLKPLRLRLQMVTLAIMLFEPSFIDPKKLTISLHVSWLMYQRVTYTDYQRESHRLIKKIVRDTIEQTPAWFRKYKKIEPAICELERKKLCESFSSQQSTQDDSS